MIVTREWLQEWIDINDVPTQELITIFNSIGLEVAEYKKIEIPKNVVVGKVVSCQKHPNADKLNLCEVDVGEEKLQIVCGAKNVVHAEYVAVAKIGAMLPGDFHIKPAKLREVESFGMICSSTELGLPKLEEGIMILDHSIGTLEVGKELREYPLLNDEIIELELTANRGDCLSILGIARELSVVLERSIKEINYQKPDQMQIGIGRIVQFQPESDIESNVAYKAFQLETQENPLLIRYRTALVGEEFKNFADILGFYISHATGVVTRIYGLNFFTDEESYTIRIHKDENGYDAVYGTKKGSIIGVIQFDEAKPVQNDTIYILETSYIDPSSISKKMYEHPVKSDWVYYRSSRGSDPRLSIGLEYAKKYINEHYENPQFYAGRHEVEKEIVKEALKISFEQLNQIIGQEIEKTRVVDILKNLGFEIVSVSEDSLIVKPPVFRHDIANIQDIAEEVVRIYGIEKIDSRPLMYVEQNRITEAYLRYKAKKSIRERAVAQGYVETVSYIFVNKEELEKYGFATVHKNLDLINPITNEMNTLRTSLVPNLLQQLQNNIKNGYKRVKLFEIGTIFDQKREESEEFVLIFSGQKEPESVVNHGKAPVVDLPTFLNELSAIIGDFDVSEGEASHKLVHPYQVAKIIKDGKYIGQAYKLHLEMQKELDVPTTYIAQIDFEELTLIYPKAKEYSVYQRSLKDLSVVVDRTLPYESIKTVLEKNLPKEVRNFYPVDIYEDESLGDKKSVTIRFAIQSFEKTLTEEEISKILEKILKILQEEIGATLR
ncbi:phenylalanine--tRNA ligase subunit beta [Nitratiruptor sp. SB155-2]|uniref:phenylalanine--tRNA ligase subunit beta n=1 Tax=Nitratiruptor sp. (strain SB155-2) TaxID=387092 RepID=UPI0001586E23|nr:phenylalanine--tRNA ligase subunit beta [Nitratiruptor sp. SB155-2]BAF69774.1 phenylalanyl-tRNA synthetase, beta subunit [Nitratiruptor sp. SB155-2]